MEKKYEAITKFLAAMCSIDLLPVNIVLGLGFRLFCRNVNEDYKVPSATTVLKYIGLEYDNVKEVVIKSLKGQHVSLTTDVDKCSKSWLYHFDMLLHHSRLAAEEQCACHKRIERKTCNSIVRQ